MQMFDNEDSNRCLIYVFVSAIVCVIYEMSVRFGELKHLSMQALVLPMQPFHIIRIRESQISESLFIFDIYLCQSRAFETLMYVSFGL